MSRWIDADALKATHVVTSTTTNSICHLYVSLEDINSAPSIDIVRCKECKKANTEDCSHSYWDDDWGEWRVGYRGDDWFCADGEREGE